MIVVVAELRRPLVDLTPLAVDCEVNRGLTFVGVMDDIDRHPATFDIGYPGLAHPQRAAVHVADRHHERLKHLHDGHVIVDRGATAFDDKKITLKLRGAACIIIVDTPLDALAAVLRQPAGGIFPDDRGKNDKWL